MMRRPMPTAKTTMLPAYNACRHKVLAKTAIRRRQLMGGGFYRSLQHLGEDIGRGVEVESFAGPLIEAQSDGFELRLG
jgi:hypothetical protein